MSILKYSNKVNPNACARNMEYICRDSAADSISFHNLDDLQNNDKQEAKNNAINYAEQRELEEESRIKGNERGTPRNHNRMIISFDRKEDTEIAKEEVHKFLNSEFSNQKAVVTIHQDQDHTHAHIWFDCRDIDTNKKTQLEPKKFRTLDERWAKQYDERYKTNYCKEYQEKKAETREWKREQAQLKREGKQPRPDNKPRRANDKKARILKAKELNDHGIEKGTTRTDKPFTSRGYGAIEASKQRIDAAKQTANRAAAAEGRAVREVKTLRENVERSRSIKNRNIDKDRSR